MATIFKLIIPEKWNKFLGNLKKWFVSQENWCAFQDEWHLYWLWALVYILPHTYKNIYILELKQAKLLQLKQANFFFFFTYHILTKVTFFRNLDGYIKKSFYEVQICPLFTSKVRKINNTNKNIYVFFKYITTCNHTDHNYHNHHHIQQLPGRVKLFSHNVTRLLEPSR